MKGADYIPILPARHDKFLFAPSRAGYRLNRPRRVLFPRGYGENSVDTGFFARIRQKFGEYGFFCSDTGSADADSCGVQANAGFFISTRSFSFQYGVGGRGYV